MIEFDKAMFGRYVRNKRTLILRVGIRKAAKEIGTTASTLSRIENGKEGSIDTVIKICYWLKMPTSRFTKNKTSKTNKK